MAGGVGVATIIPKPERSAVRQRVRSPVLTTSSCRGILRMVTEPSSTIRWTTTASTSGSSLRDRARVTPRPTRLAAARSPSAGASSTRPVALLTELRPRRIVISRPSTPGAIGWLATTAPKRCSSRIADARSASATTTTSKPVRSRASP